MQFAWCNWLSYVASEFSAIFTERGQRALRLAEVETTTQARQLESVQIQSKLAGESAQFAEKVAAAAHCRGELRAITPDPLKSKPGGSKIKLWGFQNPARELQHRDQNPPSRHF